MIYYKKELPGFLIDLNGYIDKPFDPRFYEVYLNGRRLTDRNLKAISPYEVQLNHVHSLYNFAIFERERDWEYYYQGFDIYHTLSNFIRESFMNDDMITHMIEWKIGEPLDNDNIEEPMDWSQGASLYSIFFDIFYYMSLVPLGLANADMYQWVKSNIQRNYPEVYKTYHEKDPEGGDVLLLSPDRFCVYEEESSDPEEVLTRGWGVYMLGNNEEDMQLILKSDTMNS